MYTVESAEHFEDWYVAYGQTHTVDYFDDAIRLFCDECLIVINDVSSGSGIDQYLAENHQGENENDRGWVRDYSKGFSFRIDNDDEEVLSLHLNYDPETQSLSTDVGFELDRQGLSSSQMSMIQDCLVAIRESLIRRKTGRHR